MTHLSCECAIIYYDVKLFSFYNCVSEEFKSFLADAKWQDFLEIQLKRGKKNRGKRKSMAEKKPVIRVKDLYKVYKVGDTKVRALNGVSFDIYRGEFCAIVGASGSGKSTLLNMLAGLEKPTKGEIVIAGEHMETKTENALVAFRRNHIGFIFQSFNLLPTMTAVENIALPLTFQGMDKEKRTKLAKQALKMVGLQKYSRHKPTQMSGGQQQRIGVARALVVNPEIIFADEPTGNLDSKTSEEIMGLMRKVVVENNQTLIMVTHDNHLAEYADRIFHIKDGKILKIEDKRLMRQTGT